MWNMHTAFCLLNSIRILATVHTPVVTATFSTKKKNLKEQKKQSKQNHLIIPEFQDIIHTFPFTLTNLEKVYTEQKI